MGCKPHKCPRAFARISARALRSVATMQSVKLADENCASNLSAAEASEFIVRFFEKIDLQPSLLLLYLLLYIVGGSPEPL